MSSEMVRATLEGRKTKTRRIATDLGILEILAQYGITKDIESFCPYGTVGEKLWVRESHQLYINYDYESHKVIQAYVKFEHQEGFYCWDADKISFTTIMKLHERIPAFNNWKSCPSIHLYEFFARLQLNIKSVRVEKLNDISEEDAIQEGTGGTIANLGWINYKNPAMYLKHDKIYDGMPAAVMSFASLWESIHGNDSWEENPYVWVIEYDWELIEKEVQSDPT